MNRARQEQDDLRKTFAVTEDHLRQGLRRHPELCPIAHAIREAIPGHVAAVGPETIRILQREAFLKSGFAGGYQSGARLKEWLEKYDAGENAGPCRIELIRDPQKRIGRSTAERRQE